MMGRQNEIKQERRRRNGAALGGFRNRLHVPESLLDREKYTYRWINDEPERVHQMTVEDDWDLVNSRDAMKGGMGSEVAEEVGSGATGSPLRAVLVRKPKQYHDADKAEKQRLIDEKEKGLTQGAVPGADQENTYQPETKSTISRG